MCASSSVRGVSAYSTAPGWLTRVWENMEDEES